MLGTCLTCGQFGELHAHHVAGRHNHATLTVPVCLDCHRILTGWQLAAGIELREDAARSELDATRALVVGGLHLVQLFAQRHAEHSWVSAPLVIHTARAASLLLDAAGARERAGRWLPDPTVPPIEAVPLAWPAGAEVERLAEFAHLALALIRIFGGQPPLTVEALTSAAASPAEFKTAFDRITADPVALGRLLDLIAEHAPRCQQLVLQVLMSQGGEVVDERLLDEAWLCIDTGRRLLTEVLTAVRRH